MLPVPGMVAQKRGVGRDQKDVKWVYGVDVDVRWRDRHGSGLGVVYKYVVVARNFALELGVLLVGCALALVVVVNAVVDASGIDVVVNVLVVGIAASSMTSLAYSKKIR